MWRSDKLQKSQEINLKTTARKEKDCGSMTCSHGLAGETVRLDLQSHWTQDVWNKVLWRVCFADTGSGHLAVTESTMSSSRVKCEPVQQQQQSHARAVNLQQNGWKSRSCNDPWSKTWAWLKCCSEIAVHKRIPTIFNELKQLYKEEWAKIPLQRCERLMKSHRTQLLQIIGAKRGSTSNWIREKLF